MEQEIQVSKNCKRQKPVKPIQCWNKYNDLVSKLKHKIEERTGCNPSMGKYILTHIIL